MNAAFGEVNHSLTQAVRRIAADSAGVAFVRHAEKAMEDDDFDHMEVLTCLRKGTAYGPEIQNSKLRANVVHRGLHIRVAIGGLESVDGDWDKLKSVIVVSVMRTT